MTDRGRRPCRLPPSSVFFVSPFLCAGRKRQPLTYAAVFLPGPGGFRPACRMMGSWAHSQGQARQSVLSLRTETGLHPGPVHTEVPTKGRLPFGRELCVMDYEFPRLVIIIFRFARFAVLYKKRNGRADCPSVISD